MGRNEEGIAAALELFWQKGYDETSMADIVSATGMNRYALYSTFGNKREIFLAALAAYFEQGREIFEPILRDESHPPLERIRLCLQTFRGMIEEQHNGCLICHVAVDHGSGDPVIADAVARYFNTIQGYFQELTEEARADGMLNPNLTPEQAARIAFDAELSLGVHMKAGTPASDLDAIVDATMAALSAHRSAD